MFNQMLLIDMILFIVCTSFEEELLKVLINSHAQSFLQYLDLMTEY